jgi:hypothetical protein
MGVRDEYLGLTKEIVEQYRAAGIKVANGVALNTILESNGGIFQMGDIFEAETTSGGKNYIVFMFQRRDPRDGSEWVYYCHGDRGKKVEKNHFLKLIDYGDLEFVPRENADVEKISLAVLGLKAMAEGMLFEDYLKVMHGYGDGSKVY